MGRGSAPNSIGAMSPAAMPEGLRMFPALLREAGYYTTNNSKKDYNAIEGEGVWDESSTSGFLAEAKRSITTFLPHAVACAIARELAALRSSDVRE